MCACRARRSPLPVLPAHLLPRPAPQPHCRRFHLSRNAPPSPSPSSPRQDEIANLRRQVGESRAQQLERTVAALREQLEEMQRVHAGGRQGRPARACVCAGVRIMVTGVAGAWRCLAGPGRGCWMSLSAGPRAMPAVHRLPHPRCCRVGAALIRCGPAGGAPGRAAAAGEARPRAAAAAAGQQAAAAPALALADLEGTRGGGSLHGAYWRAL